MGCGVRGNDVVTGDEKRASRRSLTAGVRVVRKGEAAQVPLWRQVHGQLRDAIARGELQSGVRIPAARTLARELKVSRNTVEAAILALVAEGLLVRRVGSGTTVAASERGARGCVDDLPAPSLRLASIPKG